MLNDGTGNFVDVTEDVGLSNFSATSIEWVTHDFDNDGYLDIMGGGGYIIRNNGDLTFTPTEVTVTNGPIGDLNNDGFLDVVQGNLYLNNGNDNNYLVVHTNGTVSNTNGIGARIEVYSSSFDQIREVRSGDGFRYMSTLNAHFGLGLDTQIDSVIVHWPSGLSDIVYNPDINTLLVIEEGQAPLSAEDVQRVDFIVFPNPVSDQLRIERPNMEDTMVYDIFDLQGKRVESGILNTGFIEVSHLNNGAYILQLHAGERIGSQKFIKQ
jgi:hypothetical protein